MIIKYAKVNPTAPFDGTFEDPCEWVWTDRVSRVVHLGIHDKIPHFERYAFNDIRGEAPYRCYMLVHEDESCDVVGFGINDRIKAYILSDDGKTVDSL